jgi:hypothetical protein
MYLELDDTERAALVQLLSEAIRGTNYELAPRPRQFTGILRKLDVRSTAERPRHAISDRG